MKTSLFDYNLPPELIANSPVSPRDHSRLMVINKKDNTITRKHFYDIIDYLNKDDVLILNKTKVFPARVFGNKVSGGKVEILLTKSIGEFRWEALSKPGLKIDTKVIFDEFTGTVKDRENEINIIDFDLSRIDLLEKLQKSGITPLPPYIKSVDSETELRNKYQTVYAKNIGSVAAPTAGFHFTDELLEKIKDKGIQIEYVTLHVGLGTFMPVKTENLEDHTMHSEDFFVEQEVITRINNAKKNGKRIVAVGSTSTRVLETLANTNNKLQITNKNSTSIFIYPPYKFKFVDAMITNFHLPKSTLMALVYAFGGTRQMKKAYKEAIKEKYRFYSFGDSMIIL
ncbi:tRNA preQ1(34) S-adenosylmethionine ribosyltransferase-isomerase QueA [Candidatus Dojkabacteria bacterium]|nr:tRNA preQ1(34) S-adenosylmethionine ribosyltransferase-isomerase QueA [Candidatus Dojkabacteria bacterium]